VVNGTRGVPGRVQRGEAARRGLVGRAVMRAARLVQPVRQRLDHHPCEGLTARRRRQLASESAPGWRGEQAGLVDDAFRDRGQVVDRARVAVLAQPGRGPAGSGLGGLAEREERFEAAERRAARRELEHPRVVEEGRLEPGRRLGERAVAAAVAAQHREGHEHFGEKVMRRPVRSSRRAAAVAIRSVRGASSSSRNDAALSIRRP